MKTELPQLPQRSKQYETEIKEISALILEGSRDKIAFVILFGSFARGDFIYDFRTEKEPYQHEKEC